MAALPLEVLFGIYLGLLTGVVPALAAGVLGFLFRYLTGVTLPGLGVVVLAVAVAGVNGGLLGLIDPSIASSPRLLVALLVVMMLSLYAHNQGDRLGATLPRRFSLRSLREQTLSAEVVDLVAGGTVTIVPTGPVEDVEGHPPLSPDLRATIAAGRWEFPGDLPLSELERRLADRLRTEHDLADVAVAVDRRGRAQIAAAPPVGALSRRVPRGRRAVSVDALVPVGMARGESVAVQAGDRTVEGTLLSARSGAKDDRSGSAGAGGQAATADGGTDPVAVDATAPTTDGGEGRVTVTVDRRDATALLRVDRGRVVVRSRGERREFELLGLVRQSGRRIERLSVRSDGPLDGITVGAADVGGRYGVALFAVRSGGTDEPGDGGRSRDRDRNGEWAVSPSGERTLTAGDELFAVGTVEALRSFREAVA